MEQASRYSGDSGRLFNSTSTTRASPRIVHVLLVTHVSPSTMAAAEIIQWQEIKISSAWHNTCLFSIRTLN